jgi:hypothetical protein
VILCAALYALALYVRFADSQQIHAAVDPKDKRRSKKKARVDWRRKFIDASKKLETERVEMQNSVQRFSAMLHHVILFADKADTDIIWSNSSRKGWIDIHRMIQTPVLRSLNATIDDILHVSRNDDRLSVDAVRGQIRRREAHSK